MSDRDNRVISEMIQYMKEFIEVSHPVFGNFPVCPFARKACLDGVIMFRVYQFAERDLETDSKLMDIIKTFNCDEMSEILLVIHPDPKRLSSSEIQQFVEDLNSKLAPFDLVGFGGHPRDRFNIRGVYTRRSPYSHLAIQPKPQLKQVTPTLRNTGYYDNWTPDNLDAIGFDWC
jgi:hypothetical protein